MGKRCCPEIEAFRVFLLALVLLFAFDFSILMRLCMVMSSLVEMICYSVGWECGCFSLVD